VPAPVSPAQPQPAPARPGPGAIDPSDIRIQPGPAVEGPIVVGPGILPRLPDSVGNFFEPARAGRAVARPHDLLALRLELQNLTIDAGPPPRLRKTATGPSRLIVHFPPQTIAEQTFWEGEKPYPAGGSDELTGPPVRARIAGESRVAFTVPDGFDVPYTLEGVLDALETLPLSVPANARPPASGPPFVMASELFTDLSLLTSTARARLTSFAARSLRIAALQDDTATLHVRQATGGAGLRAIPENQIGIGLAAEVGIVPDIVIRPTPGPAPAAPTAQQTALEIPWRLILSPHSAERWRHAAAPVTSPAGRTELWHTRLVAPKADGSVIEPPRPDPQRSVRAVWALTGEGSPKPMQSAFPTGSDLPQSVWTPFRTPMNDFSRFQIAHLSSNFSVSNYTPQAIGTNLMMLSTLGGWLDSRGAWDPPGLSVEEWVHRATMGRDHYVRVVFKGCAFPFGHRLALILVSERRFHNGARNDDGEETVEQVNGNTAYLRQRMFIVPRERERRYVETNLSNMAGTKFLHRQFPFSSVRLLTDVTPNLDKAEDPESVITTYNDQRMFWPCVNKTPFHFQWVATDLDGRAIRFSLPIIFMDNTVAAPHQPSGSTLVPNYQKAEEHAANALAAWRDPLRADRRVGALKQQRVALAPSMKAGDTSAETQDLVFDAFVEAGNTKLQTYSAKLTRPVFYPSIEKAKVRIAALAQLTGSAKTNTLAYNAHYLQHGFANNEGQVFADIVAESGMAKLDFSTQGDRSGGFVQPNLTPKAMSRLAGPVSGTVSSFISGTLNGADAFPDTLTTDLPLPLLFGCIPLGEVIKNVTTLGSKTDQIPRFVSEASTQVEQFINSLVRLFELGSQLADQPGRLADAAATAIKHTLSDLLDQAHSYTPTLVAAVQTRLNQLSAALDDVASEVQPLFDQPIELAPTLPGLAGAITSAQTAAANLKTAANASVGGVAIPSGYRQSLLTVATGTEGFLADLGTLTTLLSQAKTLHTAVDAIVGQPDQLGVLLANPGELKTRLQAVQAAMAPLRGTIAALRLLEGAPRKAILGAIDAVLQILDGVELLQLLEMFAGDELTIRFDWKPPIDNWALPGANPATDALFRANDKRGFVVAVEAKVKKNGQSAPKITVTCSLKTFDLVLIAPASFIELNFDKIEFTVDSGAKMDVDVLLSDIKFVGPLSFVETLRDLIPLDGFSDPPFLDITPQGIDAGFSLALPNVSVGVFNLSNLSLGAGFTVPFIGQPLAVRFNFCTREQPFNLTVTLFGGGGFFGITLDPHGIQILEASLEFGASISVDFGVASGGVYVMAGIYFRMEQNDCSLTGYFRLGGHVDVLGLITASLELYLELFYEFPSGKCVGTASLTIEVEVFVFSGSVTIKCQRKFAGSNGDPVFRDLMGVNTALALPDELALIDDTTEYAWRQYCEAFAA
jgi:hypothetical protein